MSHFPKLTWQTPAEHAESPSLAVGNGARILFVGKLCVAEIYLQDVSETPWRAFVATSPLGDEIGRFKTLEEAQQATECVVLSALGLSCPVHVLVM